MSNISLADAIKVVAEHTYTYQEKYIDGVEPNFNHSFRIVTYSDGSGYFSYGQRDLPHITFVDPDDCLRAFNCFVESNTNKELEEIQEELRKASNHIQRLYGRVHEVAKKLKN